MANYGDADSLAPQLVLIQGCIVMVFENDVERARKLIA
jgi:hypothetical protein